MNVFKALYGEGAKKYLPFALSRLKVMLGLFAFPTTQHYAVEDADITVRADPLTGFNKVTIDAVSATYEFHTPEMEIANPATLNPVGSITTATARNAVPTSSGFFTDPTLYPKTRAMTAIVPGYWQDPLCQTRTVLNQQRMKEYVWHHGAKGRTGWCGSTFISCNHSHEFWVDTCSWKVQVPLTDVGTDLGPSYCAAGAAPIVKYPDMVDYDGSAWAGAPDPWTVRVPGRGCVQTVVDPVYGTATYFILTDSRNDFYVYPVTPATGDVQYNVGLSSAVTKSTVYVRITPTLPAWAMATSSTDQFAAVGTVDYLTSSTLAFNPASTDPKMYNKTRYKWSFNSSGTRTCAVVCTTETNNSSALSTHYVGHRDNIMPHATTPYTGIATERQKIRWPGAVEYSIDIVRTGPLPEDFTATMTLVTGLDPATTHKVYIAADYAYYDARLEALGVKGDDLVLAEHEVQFFSTGDTPAPTDTLTGLFGTALDYWSFVNIGTVANPYALSLTISHAYQLAPATATYDVATAAAPTTLLGKVYEYGLGHNLFIGQVGEYFLGRLYALELRSLSAVTVLDSMQTTAAVGGLYPIDSGSCTVSYGQVAQSQTNRIPIGRIVNSRDYMLSMVSGSFVRQKATLADSNNVMFRITGEWCQTGSFSVHTYGTIFPNPNGSNAFYLKPEYITPTWGGGFVQGVSREVVDRVEFNAATRVVTTTHKAMFNKAFNQTRDYSYYTSAGAGLESVFVSHGTWLNSPTTYVP